MKTRIQNLSKEDDVLADSADKDLASYLFTVLEAILSRRGRHEGITKL